MPQFTPLDEIEKKNSPPIEQGGKVSTAPPVEVQKAKDAAEIQKHETERIKAKQEAVFVENNIKDAEDLANRLRVVAEREAELSKKMIEFDSQKSTVLSEVQKQKAEYEQKTAESNKKEQELIARTQNVAIREKLITEREELLNSVELQKLEETENYNSLVEQLGREFPKISALMGDNANLLIRGGFKQLGRELWDEIETMERWSKNDLKGHCDIIVEWITGQVEDCNRKAVTMARRPQEFSETTWNTIVDNLERIYNLMPVLRPDYLPKDDET